MQAMRSGIRLNTLGIVKDQSRLVDIMSKASVMAAQVGIASGEGIKAISDILETGNIAQAKNLGLISETNQEYMVQQGILRSVGKGLGGYVKMQHRLGLVMSFLDSKTKGLMKGFADQRDTLQAVQDALVHLKGEVGRFLGVALAPFLKGMSTILGKFNSWLEAIQNNHKDFAKFVGSIIAVSGAILGLITLVGALTLALKMLAFVGLGPLGAFTILAMGVSILQDMDGSTEDLMDTLNTFGQVFLSGDRRMGFIDEDTKEFLEGKGLFGLVVTLSRIFGLIGAFVADVGKDFVWIWKKVGEGIEWVVKGIGDILGIDTGPWWAWMVDNTNLWRRALTGALALWLSIKGVMFAVSTIGGFLFGAKAAGTAASGALTGISALAALLKQSWQMQSGFINKIKDVFKTLPTALSLAFPKITAVLTSPVTWGIAAFAFGAAFGDYLVGRFPWLTKFGEMAAGDKKPEILDPTTSDVTKTFVDLQKKAGRGVGAYKTLTAEETISALESRFGELESGEKAKIQRMADPDQQRIAGSGRGIDAKEFADIIERLGDRVTKPMEETAENTRKGGEILKKRKDREAMSG
jgi:hypothetical protein